MVRNIGQFDSVSLPAQSALSPFTLIYGENGRGKTTMSAIFRSLALNKPELILERKRLGSQHDPHVVVTSAGSQITFQNGTWSAIAPQIAVFDDAFVSENVCSGVEVVPSHKKNLHELILGAQGVALNNALLEKVKRIEQHNADLKAKGDAIPAAARGPFTVNAFCSLKSDLEIEAKIQEAERRLAAAKSSDLIRQRPGFPKVELPDFDLENIGSVLGRTLDDLNADAASRVRSHIQSLGGGGENWIAEGVPRIRAVSAAHGENICPFCAQEIDNVELIEHYQAYFSDAYGELKGRIRATGIGVRDTHAGDVPAAIERSIRTYSQSHEFWKDFPELPVIDIDTAAISREWTAARESILEQLREKAASPLEAMVLRPDALEAVAVYRRRIAEVSDLSTTVVRCNEQLELVKEQAAADDLTALSSDLERLRATKQRFDAETRELCDEYLREKSAKKATEGERDKARSALDEYREEIFPAYETSINDFLRRFNATYRIGRVQSVNTRVGSSASYFVFINNEEVSISAENGPSFKNTLSAGDRNTLALAFFFASLEQDPNLPQKTIVIDDPMTSLDEHRSLRTLQEIRTLHNRVHQVIVLSHSKSFLCALWEGADNNIRTAFRISRTANGSTIDHWNVSDDCVTEHDKRHELVSSYIRAGSPDEERKVAEALRYILEAFMRVAYPSEFPPGSLLGQFIGICQQRHGTANEILSVQDTTELKHLLEFANRYHHDNPTWETEEINDAELLDFAERTLKFTSRR